MSYYLKKIELQREIVIDFFSVPVHQNERQSENLMQPLGQTDSKLLNTDKSQ